MKKFLLLLVGVLFALSANAAKAWTIYVDVSPKSWSDVYLWVMQNSVNNSYHGTLVPGTTSIYKFQFEKDGEFSICFTPANNLTSNWGVDRVGDFQSKNGDTDSWRVQNGALYKFNDNGNGAASIEAYTEPTVTSSKYYFSGQDNDWDNQEMTDNRDGSFTVTRNLTNGNGFGIREKKSDGTNAWWWSADTSHDITSAGTFTAEVGGFGSNWTFKMTTGVYKLTFNPKAKTLTVASSSTPDPEPTTYTISISGFDGWTEATNGNRPRFTRKSGTIYTLDLSGVTFTKETQFKIYDITGQTSGWGTGYGPTNDNPKNEIEPGVEYQLTQTNSGNNLSVTTEIKDPQFTLDVSNWTLTITPKAATPSTYSYRFHSNMVNGTWPADDNNDPAWAMTKQSDGTWMWQGSLTASGAFGFKRLADDETPGKNNQWIYCSSASAYAITLGEWSGAKLKANNSDISGHDWTFTPDGGTYQVIFDPANMQTKIVKVGGIDYRGRTYVISGTFNGWIAPADNAAACGFTYNESTGKYEWSYTGLMKNVEFKICDLTNLAEDSDKKWGKAYGTTYTGSTRDELTAGTAYNMRRTNVPGEDVLIETAELYNPTFVLDPATMTVTVTNNPVTAEYKYGIHSNFTTDSWSCVEMTEHADGSWSYTYAIPNGKRFGIRQTKKKDSEGNDVDITNKTNQTLWINSSETSNTTIDSDGCVRALVATNHGTKSSGCNWATDNSAFNSTTVYTIVFTPAKNADGSVKTDGTGTLVIYNNTAVTATIQPAMAENGTDYLIVDGQKANEIVVKVPVANYLGTDAGPFTLSMGDNAIASASKDAEGNVTFEYLPYLSGTREFTLKSTDKAVKLNVNSPELDGSYFTLDEYKSLTLVANENGYIDVAVACEPTSTLVYDIPIWYYTIGDYTYEAEEVYWSTNGFSFNVKNLAEYDPSTYKAKEEGIATCYGTPIFPFVVRKAASTLAEEESNLTIQQFGGSKASFQVKIQVNDGVSGVEGVAVENEDAPVEYYNLQGQRVNGDLTPGIYIRRQGTTVTKVRI